MDKHGKNLSKTRFQPDTVKLFDLLDTMLTSLTELLEKKGILTQEEWEQKIKEKIERKIHLKPFREL